MPASLYTRQQDITVPFPTIYALSSPAGRGAVAVVRISGPLSRNTLIALAGNLPPPRRATLRNIVHSKTGAPVDQALVLWFPAPNSFTGEDMAEFHLHGGRAVVEAMYAALAELGDDKNTSLHLAQPGEFTRRAFENGRMDLVAVEGLADLITAETEQQHLQALAQMQGRHSALYETWRKRLISALATIEVELDFADEDDSPGDSRPRALKIVNTVLTELNVHLKGYRQGALVREGMRILIMGPVNAGKSSLINWLACQDLAIVSPTPGTTRDLLETQLNINGYLVNITDTAGLRGADENDAKSIEAGSVEQEGIRRALARAQAADLILWLNDCCNPVSLPENILRYNVPVWRIANKLDLIDANDTRARSGDACISVKTGAGLDTFMHKLGGFLQRQSRNAADIFPTRLRHRTALEDCKAALEMTLAENKTKKHNFPAELLAEHIRAALLALGRITGRVGVEDMLDVLFSEFCMGK